MGSDPLGIYFHALLHITLRISSSLDLSNVLAYVTEETARALDTKAASVRLLDESGQRLEMQALYGLSEEYLNKGPVMVDRSPVDRHILAGHAQQIADVRADSGFQYPEEASREGIISIASLPLIAHGRPIGVLRVYSAERRRFSDVEMNFLQAVADLAALSIENARLYQEMRQNYEESEKNYAETMETLWGESPAV
jgi:GAF domain-containing protein